MKIFSGNVFQTIPRYVVAVKSSRNLFESHATRALDVAPFEVNNVFSEHPSPDIGVLVARISKIFGFSIFHEFLGNMLRGEDSVTIVGRDIVVASENNSPR